MEWIVALVLVVAAIAAVVLRLSLQQRAGQDLGGQRPVDLPYERNTVLLSAAERSFLGVLEKALGEDYRACPKVRVVDTIAVRGPLPRSDWQRAFNRISSKHFDFVVCRNTDMGIACAMELDDGTHEWSDRQERDQFLEAVCSSASLPLLRFRVKDAYSVSEIRERIAAYTQLENAGLPGTEYPPVDGGSEDALEESPRCPKCSGVMRLRTARKGPIAGQMFWGCANYPKCNGTRRIDA